MDVVAVVVGALAGAGVALLVAAYVLSRRGVPAHARRAAPPVEGPGLAEVVDADGERLAQCRASAATPGRSLPSSHSRKAPPAVET